MINLYDSNITDILPEVLSEKPEAAALGYAVKMAARRFLDYCEGISVYAVIDKAPDSVLDMLAAELDAPYYDYMLETEKKRKIIINTLIWYISAGTPKAVEELVKNVLGTGEVKEWFEYGDEPYYFKVMTEEVMTEQVHEQFSSMINRVKNVRSHMRGIEVKRKTAQQIYAGVGQKSSLKPEAIIDGYSEKMATECALNEIIIARNMIHSEPVYEAYRTGGD